MRFLNLTNFALCDNIFFGAGYTVGGLLLQKGGDSYDGLCFNKLGRCDFFARCRGYLSLLHDYK